MHLEVIHLDEALIPQKAFLAACSERGAAIVEAREEGRKVRLWSSEADMERFSSKLPKRNGPTLSFLGSGDFHHVSALLIGRAACNAAEPFTVIHLDNHPDWVRRSRGTHCGSWINRALAIPQVQKIITAGVCSKDLQHPEWKSANLTALKTGRLELFAYEQPPSAVRGNYGSGASYHQEGGRIQWNCISDMGIASFTKLLLSRASTPTVYITFDKDVLVREEAVTNWDQGKLRLDEVIGFIRAIAQEHAIIGADVIGDYSPVRYSGGPWSFIKKWGETLIDHRRTRLAPEEIAARNEAVNLRLLNVFADAMG